MWLLVDFLTQERIGVIDGSVQISWFHAKAKDLSHSSAVSAAA